VVTDLLPIIADAQQQNKNILIIGSPRSGTHALGALFRFADNSLNNLKEICKNDGSNPQIDITKMYRHEKILVAHIVQLSAKIALAPDVGTLKQHNIIVNLKRNNKVSQFASWMYFHKTGGVNGTWHNHLESDTTLLPHSITATQTDIDHFIIEQLTDNFFLADYVLFYENLVFESTMYKKNQYSFPIENIFSNIDYVKERLGHWKTFGYMHNNEDNFFKILEGQ
jgi:hypothetical protein